MLKTLLALGAAAVALTAMPADARPCSRWHHHHCVAWGAANGWAVGYRFAPTYAWTDYSALPQPMVTRYHLNRNWRYVNQNGHIYVVNPHTYRVTRVITAP